MLPPQTNSYKLFTILVMFPESYYLNCVNSNYLWRLVDSFGKKMIKKKRWSQQIFWFINLKNCEIKEADATSNKINDSLFIYSVGTHIMWAGLLLEMFSYRTFLAHRAALPIPCCILLCVTRHRRNHGGSETCCRQAQDQDAVISIPHTGYKLS